MKIQFFNQRKRKTQRTVQIKQDTIVRTNVIVRCMCQYPDPNAFFLRSSGHFYSLGLFLQDILSQLNLKIIYFSFLFSSFLLFTFILFSSCLLVSVFSHSSISSQFSSINLLHSFNSNQAGNTYFRLSNPVYTFECKNKHMCAINQPTTTASTTNTGY